MRMWFKYSTGIMPYEIVCEKCDFHKVEHRLDDAEERKGNHQEETDHTTAIQEFRMNA